MGPGFTPRPTPPPDPHRHPKPHPHIPGNHISHPHLHPHPEPQPNKPTPTPTPTYSVEEAHQASISMKTTSGGHTRIHREYPYYTYSPTLACAPQAYAERRAKGQRSQLQCVKMAHAPNDSRCDPPRSDTVGGNGGNAGQHGLGLNNPSNQSMQEHGPMCQAECAEVE